MYSSQKEEETLNWPYLQIATLGVRVSTHEFQGRGAPVTIWSKTAPLVPRNRAWRRCFRVVPEVPSRAHQHAWGRLLPLSLPNPVWVLPGITHLIQPCALESWSWELLLGAPNFPSSSFDLCPARQAEEGSDVSVSGGQG